MGQMVIRKTKKFMTNPYTDGSPESNVFDDLMFNPKTELTFEELAQSNDLSEAYYQNYIKKLQEDGLVELS